MKNIRDICEVAWSEIKALVTDKGILIFILFVPLVYPLLYSWVYTNEVVREVPCVVVDDSHSSLSREFTRKLDASPDVKVVATVPSMEQAQELMRRGEAYGILRFPSDLTSDLVRSRQGHIGLYCSMSSMLYYKALLLTATNVSLDMNKDIKIQGYVHGTTDRQDEINRTPITYDYVALFNPQSGFAAFLIPPVLMLIIQQTLFLGIGMAMGNTREKNGGAILSPAASGRPTWMVILGKALPYLLLYIVIAVYLYTVVTPGFRLPRLGDYGTYMVFAAIYILACIFMGMALSMLVYRREDCILLFVFLSVPMLFLSGLSWPGSNMPEFWRWVSCLFPSTFGMNGYERIVTLGDSLSHVVPELKGLLIQIVAYSTLTFLCYRRGKHHIDNFISNATLD
ncbi:MAG: ABC transporter permease [Clostridiales bacterium]|nr:ABC transporter permease [Clostridiales bacterium]